MERRIPELRFAQYMQGERGDREAFCAALIDGFRRYGFIILRDHPVPAQLLGQAYDLASAFFAQDETTKRHYIGGLRGYAPFGIEHAKDRAEPDLKEFWQIGPESGDAGTAAPANLWPHVPEGFRPTFLALFDALQKTGRILLEALTPGLALAPDFFTRILTERSSVLRLLHYPPVSADVPPGSVRSAPHEDINLLTLLADPRGPGLELLDPEDHWLPIESQADSIIVNAGDMLARLTNDVIPSATHRVINPTDANRSRYSMPFFMHPDPQFVLHCLQSCVGSGAKYPDITAGEFLQQRLRAIGLQRRLDNHE